MKPTTLCFVTRGPELLLGMKKNGFGAGKYNGFGGKIQDGETFRACAVRETWEESSLLVKEEDLECIGLLDFRFPFSPELDHIGYIYMVRKYEGVPLESEEMKPQWFSIGALPFDQMWEGDRVWLPKLLEGACVEGHVTFGEDNQHVIDMELREVESIHEVDV